MTQATRLFTHNGGQYSAFDMAQYVFWTGDEEGVAKTVEEFIEKGLVINMLDYLISIQNNLNSLQMSRENALKFLREISSGIEYLESIYSNKDSKDEIDNSLKVSSLKLSRQRH